MKDKIIYVQNICKSFKRAENTDLLVLENVNLHIEEGEIVALLGKSGSGKSTLLRIIAGLIKPTNGDVFYRGQNVKGPVFGISMVFQNFALLPWLTVLQNVELGLEAKGVSRSERRTRALKAIDTIGLDGFESAFPKELSGGMCQRVGLARALVVEPDLLIMDEPFSSLDVLTTENLRSDLMDLWSTKQTNIKGMLLVSHDIEEAVLLADRIVLVGGDPGQITSELSIDLPHPRSEHDPAFRQLVDEVYTRMTTVSQAPGATATPSIPFKTITLGHRLPEAEISEITGLLETLEDPEHQGRMDLPEVAEEVHLDVDDLFPVTEALEILRFAKVSQGDIELTREGREFAQSDIQTRKKIFAKHLMQHVPLAKHIRHILDERRGHRALEDRFLRELEDHLSENESERVLKVAIDWGRYAEIFAYDYSTRSLSLENPD